MAWSPLAASGCFYLWWYSKHRHNCGQRPSVCVAVLLLALSWLCCDWGLTVTRGTQPVRGIEEHPGYHHRGLQCGARWVRPALLRGAPWIRPLQTVLRV
jgi:hypothetical protein